MGTNRRYATAIDARMDERVLQSVAAKGALQSLSPTELRLDERPLTIDPRPRRKVRAWVRGSAPSLVDV